MSIKQLISDIENINLAKGMDKSKLNTIAQQAMDGYQDDLSNPKRQEWAKSIDEYVDIAMQVIQEKSDPWPGCANIKIPILTEAAIQFNARAYPALIPSTDIVRCATNGSDQQGTKSDRGERVGKHMTYQLKEEMEEWEDDMDKGLLILPILGCFFKKTFYNPAIGRNESRLVMPQDLVIKYDAPSIERAPRLSEVIEFYPREIKEKQRSGEWLDVDLVLEDEEREKMEEFITQHTFIDLKDNKYKMPYILTIHKNSQKIVRIVANYTERDIYCNDGTEIVSVQDVKNDIDKQNNEIITANIDALAISQQAGDTDQPIQMPEIKYPNFNQYKLTRVDSTKYYTKYGFLPSPDKSIYDIGLGHLLGPMTDAADTLMNQMLDAGSLANLQGGFKAKSAKTPSGTKRVNVSEWTDIETTGMSLRDSILPFNFPGPSVTAFNLLSFLIDFSKSIANLKDILSGEAPMGETATTSMIKREEGMRIYNAIYKRVYRAFKKELTKLYWLNATYLPQETYFNVLDTEMAIKKDDYSLDKTDISPTADPSESIQSQKIVKAEAGLRFIGDPAFNAYELKKRYLEAIDTKNIDNILPPPSNEPQPPDPLLVKTVAEVGEIEARTKKLQLETAEVISKVIKNLADAESKEAGQQLNALKMQADFLIKEATINGTKQEGPGAMEERPSDQGGAGPLQPSEAAGIEGPQGIVGELG